MAGAEASDWRTGGGREARYSLLLKAARRYRADHILTAHTRDDQAETLLMRMARGSGIAGLGAMARRSPREDAIIARPLLDVPKARLLATLDKAGISYVLDPTNTDARYTRPRFRALMPLLAAEGCDARNLTRLAGRLGRANAALELMTDGAERFLAIRGNGQGMASTLARSMRCPRKSVSVSCRARSAVLPLKAPPNWEKWKLWWELSRLPARH